MASFASINGEIAPAEQARISVLDTGFVFGDGVYETLRTYSGRPFLLERHLARLRASAARLGIDVTRSDESLAQDLDRVLSRAGNPESYIRIIVTRGTGDLSYRFDRVRGPTVAMVVKPFEPLPERYFTEGMAVIISSIRRNHPRALDPAIKSNNLLNNILAVREAQAAGCLEPILLNEAGDVAEGASSNVFAVKAGEVLTPPLSAGILAGVTRATIFALCGELSIPAREETLRAADLLGSDEAFLSSTIKEAMPISAIDGKTIGGGRPGPITLRILQGFREYARRVCAAVRA